MSLVQFDLVKSNNNTGGNSLTPDYSWVNPYKSFSSVQNNIFLNPDYVPKISISDNVFDYSKYRKSKPNNTRIYSNNSQRRNNPVKLKIGDIEYNSKKGYKLADYIQRHARSASGGDCALFVRRALEATGLSNGMRGDAWEYINILSHNPNFKEIDARNMKTSEIPVGAILVYDRGVSGYSTRNGHLQVKLANGAAGSDFITNNIKPGARIFVPV